MERKDKQFYKKIDKKGSMSISIVLLVIITAVILGGVLFLLESSKAKQEHHLVLSDFSLVYSREKILRFYTQECFDNVFEELPGLKGNFNKNDFVKEFRTQTEIYEKELENSKRYFISRDFKIVEDFVDRKDFEGFVEFDGETVVVEMKNLKMKSVDDSFDLKDEIVYSFDLILKKKIVEEK